jgi:putative nucleotidyltransferase with HDIG domain
LPPAHPASRTRAVHLAKRFAGSLRPGGPPAAEVAWVGQQLLPGELELWSAMPGPDRRHSALVARRVEAALGERATRPVLAAALLHDVGKATSRLRTPGRVVATVTAAIVGRERAARWDSAIGRYLRHAELGAQLLEASGSDPLTVAWTREHHRPASTWSIEHRIAAALKDADDD